MVYRPIIRNVDPCDEVLKNLINSSKKHASHQPSKDDPDPIFRYLMSFLVFPRSARFMFVENGDGGLCSRLRVSGLHGGDQALAALSSLLKEGRRINGSDEVQ